MKRRILALGILSFMIVSLVSPFLGQYDSHKTEEMSTYIEEETASLEENTETSVVSQSEIMEKEKTYLSFTELIDQTSEQMNIEIENIPYDFNDMNQKQDWFVSYKEIMAKYPKEFHKATIYDVYSEKELDLLFRIVQAEVGDEWDFDEKANVASVIFNRLYSGNYSSLTDVLTANGQFSPYESGRYLKVIIDEKTILACEYVFMFGDTTDDCYAFMMTKQNKWYDWTYQFSDECHHFYK